MDLSTYIVMGIFSLASLAYGIILAVAKKKEGHEKEIAQAVDRFQTVVFFALVVGLVGVTVYFS